MKSLFEKKITISFSDCDPQGIAFYSRVYEYHHEVIENFISESDLRWPNWFKSENWAVPIRSSNAEYFGPLHSGQSYRCKLFLEKLGNTSVTFCTEINAEDNLLCRVQTIHVFVDRRSFQKIPVPEEVKKLF